MNTKNSVTRRRALVDRVGYNTLMEDNMTVDETHLLVQTDNGPRQGVDPDEQPSQDPDAIALDDDADADPDWAPGPEDEAPGGDGLE